MQKDQLLELRNKILQTTQEIALRGEGDPAERMQILLSIVRAGNANLEVLTRVYELSQSIEDDSDRLSALLDVLYEVDAKLSQQDDSSNSTNQPTDVTHDNHAQAENNHQ